MSRIKGIRKWDIVIPIVDRPRHSEGGFYTDFQIAGEVDAPIFERAIEQVEKIVNPHVQKYLNETTKSHHLTYDKGGILVRGHSVETEPGSKIRKYV